MSRAGREVADRMAEAARAWLASLDADQRTLAAGPRPGARGEAEAERTRWFYTPTDHGGLTFHQQRPAQHRLMMRLVASGLSEAGYTTVATVLGLENVLDRTEGFSVNWGRERTRDPGMYYLRVFGEPGGPLPWGWRFGGHHVSLNNLVVDGRVAATTPCFLGADPAASPLLGGASLRPLGAAEDLARELVRSLRPELAARAVLLARPPNDIVTGNGARVDGRVRKRGELWRPGPHVPDRAEDPATGLDGADQRALDLASTPKGVPGVELDAAQRELLRALLGTYLGRVPEEVSALPRYDDPAALDAVHLAWAGSTAAGEPHYYRLQGPRLLVEWTNVHRGANHAHAVWRDPDTDFGGDVLAAHHAAHHVP
ncbi:DUF3500 domain-containing protein [Actinomadura madurae]|uniref:DUF3500 domain-containing protein n=1 Tax=Actinomadura madurae TaxID=1993 RepID=A0A1I5SE69_9ACTN|nr:DUF3500 domain-containing protein [Actinomadura madurae]SFP68992.1 Protein of unknown function [Actinomadura madurae]SPT64098.1 Protein of uncharacterised function (DUF3500) [Actinomadura madurae]